MDIEFNKPTTAPGSPGISQKTATIVNYVLSGIWWLLGLLLLITYWCPMRFFLFACYYFLGYGPIALISGIVGILKACKSRQKLYIWQSVLILFVSIIVAVLAFLLI